MNHKGFGKIADAFGKAKPEKTRAGHERIYMDEGSLMPAAGPKRPPTPAEQGAARKAGVASGAARKAKAGLLGK